MSPSRIKSISGTVVILVLLVFVLLRDGGGSGDQGSQGGRVSPTMTVKVVRAVDGDTAVVTLPDGSEDRVRYIGVDTPESVKPGTPVQCYAERASEFNHGAIDGRTVRLVLGDEQRDIYDRLLAYVYIGQRFLNAELIEGGYARSLTIPPNDRYAPLFKRLEREAGRDGTGLWGSCPGG